MSKKKLTRFAALIRVSTEKQEKQGESLRTQDKQIKQAVGSLSGKIVQTYAGQEHATPGWERKQLDRLLADAQGTKKPFDAVIVCDPSRWSRDNVANETGLDILQQNGIRFFVLGMEFNLFDPIHRYMLASQATLNKLTTSLRKQKSIMSCIERAKRLGAPTSGRKPFGRTWDKEKCKWGLDEVKAAMIQDVAKRYLAGERLPALAEEHGINHSFLNKTLAESCGDRYTITWNIPDLNICESVEIRVPVLLNAATIKAVRKKAIANRTYQHGVPKYDYLLQGFVFCSDCGYSMTGQANTRGVLYYRHRTRAKHCHCTRTPRPFVRADELEEAVIWHLFDTFGNPRAVELAIEEATPDHKKIEACRQRMTKLEDEQAKIVRNRNKILTLVERETLTLEQAGNKLNQLNSRDEAVSDEIEQLAASISHAPSQDEIKSTAKEVVKHFTRPKVSVRRRIAMRDANDFENMTWEDKRSLVETVFRGEMPDGQPMGVYVESVIGQDSRRRKKYEFKLRGVAPAGDIGGVTQCASGSPGPGRR